MRNTRRILAAAAAVLLVPLAVPEPASADITVLTGSAAVLSDLDAGSGFSRSVDPDAVVAAGQAREWNGRRADGSRVRVWLVDQGISAYWGVPSSTAQVPGEFVPVVDSGYTVAGAESPGTMAGTHRCPGPDTHGDTMARAIHAIAPGVAFASVRVGTSCTGGNPATVADVAAGLSWLSSRVAPGDIVSISLSGMYSFASQLNALTSAGALVVVGGNNTDGSDLCTNPDGTGAYTSTRAEWEAIAGIVVGGVLTGETTPFGAGGPCIEVVAPAIGGQSRSTAHTAAVAAAYWSGNPSLTAAQVTTALMSGPLSVSGDVNTAHWRYAAAPPPDRRVRLVGPPSGPVLTSVTETAPGITTVTWTPPLLSGGTITGYTVTVDDVPAACTVSGVDYTNLSASTRSCEVRGLTAGTHTLKVRAINAYGTGTPAGFVDSPTLTAAGAVVKVPGATMTASVRPPAPPAASSTVAGSAVQVSWSAAVNTAGTPLTGYEVYADGVRVATAAADAVAATVTGLTAGSRPVLTVRSVNKWGTSDAAAAAGTVTVPAAPVAGGGGAAGASGGGGGASAGGAGGGSLQEIRELRPASGLAGTVVSIIGWGFTGASSVTFGGVPASFRVVNDAHVEATVPAGVSGAADVAVVLSPTRGRAFAPGGFVYTAAAASPSTPSSSSSELDSSGPVAAPTAPTVQVSAIRTPVRAGVRQWAQVVPSAPVTVRITVTRRGAAPVTYTRVVSKSTVIRLPERAKRLILVVPATGQKIVRSTGTGR